MRSEVSCTLRSICPMQQARIDSKITSTVRREGQDLHGTPPPLGGGGNEGGGVGGQDSTMNRLQYEAKQFENQNGSNGMVSNLNGNGNGGGRESEEEEEEEEQFEFDLDLNPDL